MIEKLPVFPDSEPVTADEVSGFPILHHPEKRPHSVAVFVAFSKLGGRFGVNLTPEEIGRLTPEEGKPPAVYPEFFADGALYAAARHASAVWLSEVIHCQDPERLAEIHIEALERGQELAGNTLEALSESVVELMNSLQAVKANTPIPKSASGNAPRR